MSYLKVSTDLYSLKALLSKCKIKSGKIINFVLSRKKDRDVIKVPFIKASVTIPTKCKESISKPRI